ncbi:polysaccharide biosynthesis protein [uncultured Actinomyces sp.]|uniref:lipopolysaccharide biosynthesis protein n=3 Tax=Actinomyces TaxID=1654 RepID=UPI0028D1357B|nr:polysaccharide biosynthesis protein [uncultured Actinomyces sp.]
MTRTRSAPSPGSSSGSWAPVRRAAMAKVVVMGAAGVFGLINTRLIIGHFGSDAYAQYGLLATFPSLMPFTDLGIGAVILNAVAGSSDLHHDAVVRRVLTTAIRVLLSFALIIATVGVVLGLLGLWPSLLGAKLMDGGGVTATLCLLVYAAALPLSVGQRVVVGMGRSATQVISQGIVSPALTCMLLLAVVTRLEAGNSVPVMSYVANTFVSIICIVVAWRATGPLLGEALRDVPRLRRARGVKIIDTAAPSLLQSLVIPIAFQTDRLLLSHRGVGQALAQYQLAQQLFGLLTQTVAVTGIAMWPHFAKARAQGRIESPFRAAGAFAGLGAGLGLALLVVTPWVTPFLSDGKFELPMTLLVANVANVVVEAAKQPLGMYMTDPRGLRAQVVPVLVVVVMNLALSWVLIPPLGAAGPLIGSVVSVIVCQLVPYSLWVARDLRRLRGREGGDGGRGPAGPGAAPDGGGCGPARAAGRSVGVAGERNDEPERAPAGPRVVEPTVPVSAAPSVGDAEPAPAPMHPTRPER